MKRLIAWLVTGLLPAALVLTLLTGCETAAGMKIDAWQEGGTTVYACGGLEIPVPSEYTQLLDIRFSDPEGSYDPSWADENHMQTLFSCREKASADAAKRDHPGEDQGEGWLFSICRLDQVGLEKWLVSDGYGSTLFARDNNGGYYLAAFPTDMRFYRNGNYDSPDENPALWESWYRLNEWSETVADSIVERGGALKRYDAFALYRRDYTYSGAHAEVAFRPAGNAADTDATLILSQPVKQGRGGIWCVERVRYACDGWTDTRLNFPVGEGIDVPADEYYMKLQADSDKHPEMLTPTGAALAFARNAGWVAPDEGENSFVLISQH